MKLLAVSVWGAAILFPLANVWGGWGGCDLDKLHPVDMCRVVGWWQVVCMLIFRLLGGWGVSGMVRIQGEIDLRVGW